MTTPSSVAPSDTPPATPPADPGAGAPPATPPAPSSTPPATPPAGDKAPEYALTFHESVKPEDPLASGFKAWAQEHKLEAPAAQKAVDLFNDVATKAVEARKTFLEQRTNAWREAVKTDKELGGANFEASNLLVAKAMEKVGFPEFTALMEDPELSALGNHPVMFRFMAGIGKLLAEDSIGSSTGTGTSAAPARTEEQLHRALFPTMFPR